MKRDEIIQLARDKGLIVKPCHDENFIAVRSFKTDSNEAMRMGANGAFYTRGDDGWMYQVGTVEDVENYVRTL